MNESRQAATRCLHDRRASPRPGATLMRGQLGGVTSGVQRGDTNGRFTRRRHGPADANVPISAPQAVSMAVPLGMPHNGQRFTTLPRPPTNGRDGNPRSITRAGEPRAPTCGNVVRPQVRRSAASPRRADDQWAWPCTLSVEIRPVGRTIGPCPAVVDIGRRYVTPITGEVVGNDDVGCAVVVNIRY